MRQLADGSYTNFVEKILSNIKTHTIRRDEENKYIPSLCFEFVSTDTMSEKNTDFVFAKGRVSKVQNIEIKIKPSINYYDNSEFFVDDNNILNVSLDGVDLDCDRIFNLSKNDGFESLKDFFEYFQGKLPFKGKLIHWELI